MIDVVTVINLDRTPQRLAAFERDNPGFNIRRFAAVDGALLSRTRCIDDGIITDDNLYSVGALGNAMSHIALWKQCAAGTVPLHIVEDDVVLRADFSSMASTVLERLETWDIVLWMHNFDWPLRIKPLPGVGHAVLQYEQMPEALDLDAFRQSRAVPNLLPLASAAGVGCYSVTPAGAARMLGDCLPIGSKKASYVVRPTIGWNNGAIDVEMCRHYDQWRAYIAFPPLAVALNDQSVSTIRGHLAELHHPSQGNRAVR